MVEKLVTWIQEAKNFLKLPNQRRPVPNKSNLKVNFIPNAPV